MLIVFCGDLTNLIEALPLTYLVLFSKHNNRIAEAKLAIGFIINHRPQSSLSQDKVYEYRKKNHKIYVVHNEFISFYLEGKK